MAWESTTSTLGGGLFARLLVVKTVAPYPFSGINQ